MKAKNKLKKIEVIIDRSKWRTGLDSLDATGWGDTALRNSSGFKCCLGFITKAAKPRCSITSINTPADTNMIIPELSRKVLDSGYTYSDLRYVNTNLAKVAMNINDSETFTPQEKEKKLKALFKKSRYKLRFVGKYRIQNRG